MAVILVVTSIMVTFNFHRAKKLVNLKTIQVRGYKKKGKK